MNREPRRETERCSSSAVRAAAFDRVGACAAVLDRDGVIVETNQAWRLFTHLNGGSIDATGVGANYLDVCDRAAVGDAITSAQVASGLRQILHGERERIDIEYPCPSPTEDRWFLLQASALPMGGEAGAVVFHLDITAHKQLAERLVVLADNDPLTGLPNRRAALRYLDEHLALARAAGESLWVLFIDIDDFKAVNDGCGHHVGDALLVEVGKRCRRALRDADRLCRFGGDEFVAICPGMGRTEVLELADALRTIMSSPCQIGEFQILGRISVGIAEGEARSTADSLLRTADRSMYIDKRDTDASWSTVAVQPPPPQRPTMVRLPAAAATSATTASATVTAGSPSNEQSRAAAALTNSNDLILFFTGDGTIEWASPACTHLLGISAGDFVGRNGVDMIHPDDQTAAVLAFMSIPNRGDQVRTEFRVIDADGRIRWIEEIATNLIDDPAVGSVVGNLRDVTERVDLLNRIELDRRRLADAQAAARLGSFEIDLETRSIARSDELCRILGAPVGSEGNSGMLDMIHPDDRDDVAAMLDQATAGREQNGLEYRIVRPNGEVRWVRAQGVKLAKPALNVITGALLDITDRHAAEEALEFQATHDWLTGLPNPASLHTSLQQTIDAAPADTHVTVAVVGIDNFRQLNDARGTVVGDDVLRSLGRRLRTRSESGDLIGRIRGDEFVVARVTSARVADPSADDTDAVEFGQRLRGLLAEPSVVGDEDARHAQLSFSVGVTISRHDDSPERILADADAAMREAKRAGGGRVVDFDDAARARAARRRTITAALPLALEQGELHLEFQPIVELTDLRTVGFEALLRWSHPQLGAIAPDEFIPIAEADRLIVPIGTWVIEQGLQQLADWRRDPRVSPDLWLAINLSAQQLAQDDLASHVRDAMQRLGIPPRLVHLEITESVLMDRVDNGRQTIAALHSLGVDISIDDFGTGYSSLSYLSRLTVDTIKIDRAFVNALTAGREGTSIIRAMVTLANSLGLDTVAEGVETSQQLDTLRGLGCTNGQGFLWSRALRPDDALRWVLDDSGSVADDLVAHRPGTFDERFELAERGRSR